MAQDDSCVQNDESVRSGFDGFPILLTPRLRQLPGSELKRRSVFDLLNPTWQYDRSMSAGDAATTGTVDLVTHPMHPARRAGPAYRQKGKRTTGTDTVRVERSGVRRWPRPVSRQRGRGGRIRREVAPSFPAEPSRVSQPIHPDALGPDVGSGCERLGRMRS